MIVSNTRKFNLFSLLALLSVGILSALLAVYFLSNYWLTIIIVATAHTIFCSFLIYQELNNKKRIIQNERDRAEVAETYIKELQQYVNEQDQAIESLKNSKEKFRHAAFHDALTDLPNRNLFLETLKFILEKHKQTPNYSFAVLFLDLNRFKTINDSLGHSTGDRLILNVAKRLTEATKEGDLVARFSGDEFGIILNNVAGIEETFIFADFIRQKIGTPVSIAGREVFSSVSIGIAMANKDYEEADDILRDADIAMYHAKESTKGIEVFNRSMHTRALTLLHIETDLRYALERNELCAFYQPIIDLGSMQLVGFESLIRWNHPTQGLIPPGEFIPVSEDTNLIIPITLWMLHHSCEQLYQWQSKSPLNQKLFLSVNLSGKHFAHRDLVNQVHRILVDTKIDPSTLKLELTESAVMENPEMVIKMLKELKSLGVQLSIDDFGTGYSSLSYLHRFPIDTLKVDRSFVSRMEDGTENGEIVRTIISLAKTLGMNIVAEGIETVHQLHQLRILKCEYGQGYLFSRPVPIDDAEEMIDDRFRWQKVLPPSPNGLHQPKPQPIQIGLTQ
jgi:diguanylate cyclase (GGDEF)-like protein